MLMLFKTISVWKLMKNKKLARNHDPPTLNDFFVAVLKQTDHTENSFSKLR